ncbi:MAG: TAXI family TRAP transporter solute-binding subunit, partial [Nitrososphaerota archaeon]|nr:TAXI family TRAP transporter solute-binding subunit [Nitrososphaerota archaeon]
KDLPVDSLAEVKAKRYPIKLSLGPTGVLPAYLGPTVFAMYGMSVEDIKRWGGSIIHASWTDSVNMVRDGHIDGIFTTSPPKDAYIVELTTVKPCKVLTFEESIIDAMKEYGYGKGYLPGGTYKGIDKDILTFTDSVLLSANPKLPDDAAYLVTKLTVENKPRLVKAFSSFEYFEPTKAHKDLPVPLHKGAERYYREKGLIT